MFTLIINLIILKTYVKLKLTSQYLEILYSMKTKTTCMVLKFFGIIVSLRLKKKKKISLSQYDSNLQFWVDKKFLKNERWGMLLANIPAVGFNSAPLLIAHMPRLPTGEDLKSTTALIT